MSNTLPLTVQDDIEAKERYSNKQRTYCSSRRLRLWTLLICVFLSTAALIKYSGIDYKAYSPVMVTEDQELLNDIEQHPLIVYSKTYCPYSQRAKKILKTYQLKPFKIVEVDLRDDDYQVKMALKEISDRETFPNIFIQGKTIGGCDDLERLHETGELKNVFMENHLLEN
ncbi:unnamed protein product [Rhizopus stolonifer]